MAEENKTKKEETPKNEKAHEEEKEQTVQEEQKTEEKIRLLDEPITVKDLILMTMYSLEGKAWAYLDLVVHPETQKHKKDEGEAKLAIDTIDTLFKIIEEQLSPDEKKDVQVRLTNLRLNFAKK